jgi:hypothetical protein
VRYYIKPYSKWHVMYSLRLMPILVIPPIPHPRVKTALKRRALLTFIPRFLVKSRSEAPAEKFIDDVM